MKEIKKIKFRASSVGNLLVGGNQFTEKNFIILVSFFCRKHTEGKLEITDSLESEIYTLSREYNKNRFKPLDIDIDWIMNVLESSTKRKLTPNQNETLLELLKKIKEPFEFGETAKSYIQKEWLRREMGFDEPVFSKEMLKGLRCEQDSFDLLKTVRPIKDFRANAKRF